jgi:glycosyltransferase involved in cell wall biosynthesis
MISVIVPTYNEEAGITACLKSLCSQTLARDEYEIIVVDGNSSDRTRELTKEYADEVFIQTSKKVGGARNDGVMRAKGDIVATTDADCIIPPDWLEVIKKDFEKKDIVQLYGTVYPIEDGIKNRLSLIAANTFSCIGYYTGIFYYTLGCNTAFSRMRVGFSMRRYQQFGTLKSLYEWFYIVARGGETSKFSYSKRKYK